MKERKSAIYLDTYFSFLYMLMGEVGELQRQKRLKEKNERFRIKKKRAHDNF
jgi:hypothetical protein